MYHFSICARHPCAGAVLIFSVSFQFERMVPQGNPQETCMQTDDLPVHKHARRRQETLSIVRPDGLASMSWQNWSDSIRIRAGSRTPDTYDGADYSSASPGAHVSS